VDEERVDVEQAGHPRLGRRLAGAEVLGELDAGEDEEWGIGEGRADGVVIGEDDEVETVAGVPAGGVRARRGAVAR
jgi:hypothetical protein